MPVQLQGAEVLPIAGVAVAGDLKRRVPVFPVRDLVPQFPDGPLPLVAAGQGVFLQQPLGDAPHLGQPHPVEGQRRLHVGLLPGGLPGITGGGERAADLVDKLYGGHGGQSTRADIDCRFPRRTAGEDPKGRDRAVSLAHSSSACAVALAFDGWAGGWREGQPIAWLDAPVVNRGP